MTEFLMFLVILALLAFIGWLHYDHRIERERLINRLIAKTPSEVRVLDNEPRRPDRATRPEPALTPDERDFWADFDGPVGI